jgi:pimeloyl-ACP methyl ester carboxylesterase
MSTPGGLLTGQPAFSVLPLFLRRPPRDREAYAEHLVTLFAKIGSSVDLGRDEDALRAMALASFDRGISAAGNGRQLAAVLADRGREARLAAVQAPTLVIHGTADRLVRPSGGRATADAIPGANLMLVEGMGHDLPRGAWDRIVDAIVSNAARARATPDDAGARAA